MASNPVVHPDKRDLIVPDDLRSLLHLRETATHYVVQTLSGATLLRLKSTIAYPWELLNGIMDDGKDTTEERRVEREREWSRDNQTLGRTSAE